MPLALEGEEAPEWIHVTPAGPQLNGEDGRVFRMPDATSVARESLLDVGGRHRNMVLDWEHATQRKGRRGEKAPAAGWVTALQSRADGIWGRVEWTDEGRRSVEKREYRYLSPVLGLRPGSLEVQRVKTVALTNDPNLSLTALNSAGGNGGQPAMDEKLRKLLKRIAAALGMDAGDHDADAVEAQCQALVTERDEALNRAGNPPLAEFVPRAQYDAALNRASEAETRLADREKAGLDARVDRRDREGPGRGPDRSGPEEVLRGAVPPRGRPGRVRGILQVHAEDCRWRRGAAPARRRRPTAPSPTRRARCAGCSAPRKRTSTSTPRGR